MKRYDVLPIIGKKFGRLFVIKEVSSLTKRSGRYTRRIRRVLAVCSCGIEKVFYSDAILHGVAKSCGCLRKELGGKNLVTHGLSHLNGKKTRLYNIWCGIKYRCGNDKIKNYGGRGISVNPIWAKSYFEFFKWSMRNGYKENLTIDRINPNGNYSPENCRWITVAAQNLNRRNNRKLSYRGKTMTLVEWSKELKVTHGAILNRIKSKLSKKEIFHKGYLPFGPKRKLSKKMRIAETPDPCYATAADGDIGS